MEREFIENLEGRMFLSAGAILGLEEPRGIEAAVVAPMTTKANIKRMPRLGDVFKGTSKWYKYGEYDSARITLKVTKVISKGVYTLRGTSPDDSTAKYTYHVHMKANGSFTYEFTGRNYYGSDTGKGSGKMSLDGKSISGSGTSSQGTRPKFSAKLS